MFKPSELGYAPSNTVVCMQEETAKVFASQRKAFYGISVTDGFYHVGNLSSLVEAGVQLPKGPRGESVQVKN